MQREEKEEKSKASRQKEKKHGMDTERETQASVVGVNALCER